MKDDLNRMMDAMMTWRQAVHDRDVNPVLVLYNTVPYSPHAVEDGTRHYCNSRDCEARMSGNYSVRWDGEVVWHE